MGLAALIFASVASAARSFVPRQAAASSSVLRRATAVINGLQELPLDRYDAIILDQYGVLHNGEALLDGVAEALASEAIARGNMDNTTVCVIELLWDDEGGEKQ